MNQHDQQWDVMRKFIEDADVNLETYFEILEILLAITEGTGYGKVNIVIQDGIINDIKFEQTKLVSKSIKLSK